MSASTCELDPCVAMPGCVTDGASWEAVAGPTRAQLAGDELWMSWAWLRSWWDTQGGGRRLRVLVAEQAACPLYWERRRGWRRLALLGSGNRRHQLAAPGGDFAPWAARWSQQLAERRDWDVFDLTAIPQAQAAAWMAALGACGLHLGPAHVWRQ